MNRKVHRIKFPLLGDIAWMRDPQGEAVYAGGLFLATHLRADHFRQVGPTRQLIESYDLGSGVVTTAGVVKMAADWTNANATIKDAKYHDCGTGTVAAAIGDTALGTPFGGARVAGSQNNTSNVYTTVATIPFTSTLAITEWGLFTATTSVTLWDRRVFAAINVVNLDSIQFTYDLTITAGG